MNIHPTAIVHPHAQLGDGVEVQAFTIIGPHVSIGPNSVVGPHCVIDGRTEIGAGNRFFSGAQIGVLPQDLKHRPASMGRTRIGDRNVFREHVTVSSSTITSDEDDADATRLTSIGSDCLFMTCSHVAHDCLVGDRVIVANSVALAGHVTIEDKAILGGIVGVHQECVIGTLAFVGGLARIAKDVPPYMIVEGNPARCFGPNTIGLQRNGFDEKARAGVKQMYKILCRSDLNTTQALDRIEQTIEPSGERDHFLGFIRRSTRGIIK